MNADKALVKVGQFSYEIMLPGYCAKALADKIGSDISLCTMEYYEGTPGGGNLVPKIIGFLRPAEKDFFVKVTTVKGIGVKKALQMLSLPIADIAAAIENSDDKMLMSLPAVGKRMAQQIIAELKGKLQSFAAEAGFGQPREVKLKPFQAETLEILIAWGEKRNEVMELIELACERHPDINSAESLVPLIYRLKQGIEV